MPLASLDHITINTAKPDETVEFYTHLLGMHIGWRPPLDFPGKWLYVGDRAVIHLVYVENQTEAETGDFDHFAFLGSDFDGIKAKLVARGIQFRENKVAGGSTMQLFFPDPNNVKVEINFPPNLQA
jgi:catechol 2,3-dioxygenase-like lactoylglutathione lyase family enzyme